MKAENTHIQTKDQVLQQLDFFNTDRFVFNEEAHTYFHGKKQLKSVTRFVDSFKAEFDSDTKSREAAVREGVEQQVILDRWQATNDYACNLGHKVHKYLEDYYSDINPHLDEEDADFMRRIACFESEIKPRLAKLESVIQEKRVFSIKLMLAGTMDALFLMDGVLYILDWKTNKKFTTDSDNSYGKFLLPPFQDYKENKLNLYSIQLNTYKLILAEQGVYVKDCMLVYIPPTGKGAQIHRCKPFTILLEAYFGVSFFSDLEKSVKNLN